eukprot:5069718-Pyramimonas_sp.AAC.1
MERSIHQHACDHDLSEGEEERAWPGQPGAQPATPSNAASLAASASAASITEARRFRIARRAGRPLSTSWGGPRSDNWTADDGRGLDDETDAD